MSSFIKSVTVLLELEGVCTRTQVGGMAESAAQMWTLAAVSRGRNWPPVMERAVPGPIRVFFWKLVMRFLQQNWAYFWLIHVNNPILFWKTTVIVFLAKITFLLSNSLLWELEPHSISF